MSLKKNFYLHLFLEPVETYRKCYGVDIQGDSVVCIKAEKRMGKVVVSDEKLPLTEDIPVCTAVSSWESVFRIITAPFSSFRKAKKVFPTLLDVKLPFALEDCQLRFVNLERTLDKKISASVVLIRKKDLLKNIGDWNKFSINPIIVDHEGLAIWDQYMREGEIRDSPKLHIVIYAGEDRAFVVAGYGRQIQGIHAISVTLPVSDIKRILRTYCNENKRNILCLLTGPIANDTRFSSLSTELSDFKSVEVKVMKDPEKFLAKSLAVRGVLKGEYKCNFREGDFVHPIVVKKNERKFYTGVISMLISGLVMLGLAFAGQLFMSKQLRSINEKIGKMLDEIAGYHVEAKGEHGVKVAKEAFLQRREKMKFLLIPFEKNNIDLLSEVISNADEAGITIDTLNIETNKIEILGSASLWDSPQLILTQIGRWGYNARIERKDAGADERIPFKITGNR